MKKLAATAGLAIALGGIVGGVAVAQSHTATHEAPMVVVPAAQPVVLPSTGTPAPTTTVAPTTAPAPVKTTTAAPVKTTAAPAPVQSVQAAPAPAPVKQTTVKRYAVSAQPADTTGTPTPTSNGGGEVLPGNAPMPSLTQGQLPPVFTGVPQPGQTQPKTTATP